MSVETITNPEPIARFLNADRVLHAYPLGYLDPKYAEACRWVGEWQNGELAGLALVYTGLSRAGLFTMGRADSVRPLLRALGNDLPRRVVAHIPPDHRASIESVMQPMGPYRRMKRLGLHRDRFIDSEPPSADVDTLTHRDTAAILALYEYWPDNFFEPYNLESGLYFGIRDGDSLAAIAGTHHVSETFDVAAIGNLVTHPDHRGKGYASACTGALLRAAFERVRHITLDVEEANEAAMRTYQRFGFEPYGEFFEVEMVRR